jgi:hypothetical protein
VFENGVLRKIFGSKREELTENRRKQHIEKLHDSCLSPYVIGLSNTGK